ncbi:MAG: hypothetical protein RR232_02060 [Clostridia bacterium]
MRKKIILAAITIILVLLAVSCKNKNTNDDIAKLTEGFATDGELKGGVQITEPNVSDVKISDSGDDVTVSLKFLSGSRLSGGESESPASAVPTYRVYMLPSPARLVIELPGLAYWDYVRNFEVGNESRVAGYFQNTNADSTATLIYLQLTQNAAFKTEESGDTLNITLRMLPDTVQEKKNDGIEDVLTGKRFYVIADAYRDYCDGVLSRQIDMQPVLCGNGIDVVLISNPFDSEGTATSFMQNVLAGQENAVESDWRIVTLSNNEFPQYDESYRFSEVYNIHTARINNNELTPPVFIEDGLFLCVSNDRDGYLYSKRIVGGDIGEASYAYQQIYIKDNNGESRRLLKYEFETIEKAMYSPDGRKLAVLCRVAESSHLYVFDMDTKELLVDLADTGIGDMVSAFTWDDMGSAIYAVGGASATQVHEYDFNVPDQNNRHSVVDKKGADEGCIAYCNGEVYFVETDMNNGPMIYRIKPDGGVRKNFMPGSAFALSSNNKYMAINASSGDYSASTPQGEQPTPNSTAAPNTTASVKKVNRLELYDMTTGETKLITDAFAVYDFLWSWDCTKLYYFENRLSGGSTEGTTEGSDTEQTKTDPFPYTLWAYNVATGENSKIADLPYTSIAVSNRPNDVYLLYYDEATGGNVLRATYAISVTNRE